MSTADLTIRLERFVQLRELNKLCSRIRQRQITLWVPKSQQQDTPFLDASVAHFFASIGRWGSDNIRVKLYFDAGPDLEAFCRTLPGMTLAMSTVPVRFANNANARPALDEKGREILAQYQQLGFDSFPEQFQRFDTAFFLSCETERFGRPGFFDLSDGSEAISRGVFLAGQENLIEYLTGKFKGRSKNAHYHADVLQKVGVVFHELLTNASKFAKSEIDGRPIDHVFRSLSYRFFSPAMNRSIAEDPAIGAYLAQFRSEFTTYLELCFWDSGPGLARHFLRHSRQDVNDDLAPEKIAPSKELEGTTTCFNKLKSAEAELGQGFGLNDVMREMSQVKGFIRIRTGRLDLFRDLSVEPYGRSHSGQSVTFRHLITGTKEPHFTGWAWGTLYSVVIPWK
jgi:hypothetical protein